MKYPSLPHPAKHGEFVPGQGWYDANNRWWRLDPKLLSAEIVPPNPSESQREEFKRMQAQARGDFRVDPQLERLRALRDSDRSEEREKAEKMLAGSLRMQLSEYETAKRKHVADGGELSEGVAAPDGE